MTKKLKAFRLSDEAIEKLQTLCKIENRSEANMVERLIIEAVKKVEN
jgi:predicted DNA-binding protein